jgi:hypothetical protein
MKTGTRNPPDEFEPIALSTAETKARLATGQLVWSDIRRDGIVIYGRSIRDLYEAFDSA